MGRCISVWSFVILPANEIETYTWTLRFVNSLKCISCYHDKNKLKYLQSVAGKKNGKWVATMKKIETAKKKKEYVEIMNI